MIFENYTQLSSAMMARIPREIEEVSVPTEKTQVLVDPTQKELLTDKEIFEASANTFYRILARKVTKTVAVAAAIRFIIKLLFKKLSLLAALREPVPIWRFAAGAGLFNLILNLVRRLIALRRKQKR